MEGMRMGRLPEGLMGLAGLAALMGDEKKPEHVPATVADFAGLRTYFDGRDFEAGELVELRDEYFDNDFDTYKFPARHEPALVAGHASSNDGDTLLVCIKCSIPSCTSRYHVHAVNPSHFKRFNDAES